MFQFAGDCKLIGAFKVSKVINEDWKVFANLEVKFFELHNPSIFYPKFKPLAPGDFANKRLKH